MFRSSHEPQAAWGHKGAVLPENPVEHVLRHPASWSIRQAIRAPYAPATSLLVTHRTTHCSCSCDGASVLLRAGPSYHGGLHFRLLRDTHKDESLGTRSPEASITHGGCVWRHSPRLSRSEHAPITTRALEGPCPLGHRAQDSPGIEQLMSYKSFVQKTLLGEQFRSCI